MLHLNQTSYKKLSKYKKILGVILAEEILKNKKFTKNKNKTLIEIAIDSAKKVKN